jgi:AcrR family transcriptional regulator
MSPERLDRDDWVTAGLTALEERGVEAVAAAPLARTLGVTRGSFYWHFASRDDLLAAVLERWERLSSDDLIDQLALVPDPYARLQALLTRSSAKPPSVFVRLLDAAQDEPLVAAVLERSTRRRTELIAGALRELGMSPAEARRRAVLLYTSYIGLAYLLRQDPDFFTPRERAAYSRHLLATLVPSPD